ncbi:hypothetical protein BAS06_19730 [Elizabethkingia miricola]|uniref:hypothetical protein n=1 Tax=Elizabethkingia miricola TaxID=172045 RepID=UPI000999F15D|nr:hypothetical protein [Elizabethkingia miricola]OPB84490.1 hypothetical protein BAS06_19730 [Elizabethkingia miricola]
MKKKIFCQSIFVIICLFLVNCKENNKDIHDFNDYSFDTVIPNDWYGYGYEFKIDNLYYIDKTYSFYYHPQNLEELKFLLPGTIYADTSEYTLYWRYVNPPFRIIKKANSDTLILIKEGKKFIFKRVYDPARQ